MSRLRVMILLTYTSPLHTGACGSCPSSSMTMKMGLERKLKEKIPEIAEVVQTLPDVPEITTESVEKILDSVRPFLAVAGGT